VDNLPLLSDLRLFYVAARRSSFVATAAELGASPAFVSKRIAILEKTLRVTLFHRTTRRIAITEEGEAIYEWARKILEAADVWAVCRNRLTDSAKLSLCVLFLQEQLTNGPFALTTKAA
jgi:hypothetical protein